MGIFSLLEVKKKLQAPKREHLVKVALLNLCKPPVKKVVPKPVVAPTVVPPKKIIPPAPPIVKEKPKPKPIVKPKKIIKKHKPKKVHKKIIKKVKPKKVHKKIVKKVIRTHKPKPKKIVKKHRPTPKPKKVHKKIVKKYKPEPKKIVREIIPTPKKVIDYPIPITQPITKATPQTSVPTDNDRVKKAFLNEIRNKLNANKKYPKIALRRHIESSIKVRFDISATGKVSNIRCISGKRIFYKSIKKTFSSTFVNIPSNMRGKLPIFDVSIVLHFNIR